MKKIASITPLYNNEFFIRAHFKRLSSLDVNIVILGNKPWPEYERVYGISQLKDNTEKILIEEFPSVIILKTDITEHGAELLNPAVELAEQLGCGIVVKLDVDWSFTDDVWKSFEKYLRNNDFTAKKLDFRKNTVCCLMNFNYCCDGNVFVGQGADPIILNTKYRFVGNLTTNAPYEEVLSLEDFMIYHLHFKPSINEKYVKDIENKYDIVWYTAPLEIESQYTK